jgi:hypothetical protein
MAEIINLRQFRKAQERRQAERKAEANRLAFGRTKSEREMTEAVQAKNQQKLDGHRLEGRDAPKPETAKKDD